MKNSAIQIREQPNKINALFKLLLILIPYAKKKTAAANLEHPCKYKWFEKTELLNIIEARKLVEMITLNHNGSLLKAFIIYFNRFNSV